METIYVRVEKDLKIKFEESVISMRKDVVGAVNKTSVITSLLQEFVSNPALKARILERLHSET